jgi:hypothetical protein
MQGLMGCFRRDPDLLRALLVFVILVLVWAPDAVFGEGVYWHHDLRHHHYPWRVWAAGEWLDGHIPTWCPGVANGYPLMADGQVGAFYPPTMLLFMLLPPPFAMNASILGHLLWAALGGFLLARALGRSPLAATLAGVAFAFGGFFTSHTLYLGMQNAISWLPFTLWAVVRATSERPVPPLTRGRAWVLVSLGLAMSAVAGHPQIAVYSWLLAGSFWLWRARPSWRRPGALVGFPLAVLAALMLASPQIAASMELSRFSMREGGVGAAFAGIGSLPPWEIVNAVVPDLFGLDRPADIVQSYYHRGTGYWGSGENHWEMCFYLGVPLALLSVAALRRREDRFWVGLAMVAILLMLGRHTPLYALVRHIPGLSYFRFPVRFALYLSLSASLLAASGLDLLRARLEARRSLRSWALLVALLCGGALLMSSGAHLGLRLAREPLRERLEEHFLARNVPAPPALELGPLQAAALPDPERLEPELVPVRVASILDALEVASDPFRGKLRGPLLFALALLGLGVLARRRPVLTRGVLVGVLGLSFLDLYLFGHDYHPRVPRALVEKAPELLDHLLPGVADYRVTTLDRRVDPRLDTELVNANLGLLWGLSDVIVPSPLLLVRNDLFLGLAGLDIGASRGRVKVERLLSNLHLADLLSLRVIVTTWEIDDPRLRELMRLEPGPLLPERVLAYENPGARPLVSLVHCVRPLSGPEAVLERLAYLDPLREALVETGGVPVSSELLACDDTDLPSSGATLRWHDARLWQARVETNRDALLVFSESHYPGWEATVDEISAPILPTNLILRGVPVPAGKHIVELRYQPDWLPRALTALLLAALGLVGTWFAAGTRGRRAERLDGLEEDSGEGLVAQADRVGLHAAGGDGGGNEPLDVLGADPEGSKPGDGELVT